MDIDVWDGQNGIFSSINKIQITNIGVWDGQNIKFPNNDRT